MPQPRKKLAGALKRADIISTFTFGRGRPAAFAAPEDEGEGGKGYEPGPYEPESDENVQCPECGKLNSEDAAYCDQCGFKLAGAEGVQVKEADDTESEGMSADGTEALAAPADAEAPAEAAPADEGEPSDQEGSSSAAQPNQPPETEGSEDVGPEFSIPVLIIEGQPTGDGREIEAGALTWRTPPLPLMLLATETHDPAGWDLNDPAVLAGRIETLTRAAGESGTQIISATGHFLNTDEGRYAAELVEQMGRLGVSGDVAVDASEYEVTDTDDIGIPMEIAEKLTAGTIMGATICPYAAFEGAYIVLAEAEDAPAEPIEQASEQPEAVTAGGQLIHWMSYAECEPCESDVQVVVAAGGPERPPASWFADPGFDPEDGRMVEILGRHGRREGGYACPLTVTDEGRVYGHLAPWGVCHAGKAGQCITPPQGGTYVHFTRNQHLLTAEGERVNVGVITADTGHAGLRLSPSAAMAHYDDTAFAAAYVAVGEDAYGIWVAGAIAPQATEAQVQKLRAASISGDWRKVSGRLELIAALAVNMPGYPITPVAAASTGGAVEAVTAAGAVVMGYLKREQDDGRHGFGLGELEVLMPLAKDHALRRIDQLRA